ncbi:MAG: PSP1 C-terminal domain-containing protein [Pirellulales bacterium]
MLTRLGLAKIDSMSRFHLVRVGAMGQVGRFSAVDAVRYPRNCRVIVRTRRGLEIGNVLAEPDEGNDSRAFADGELLRGMTVEDELLEARLEQHRHDAYQACAELLAEHKLPAVLVDVEHLFDGQGLFFYFLGDVPPAIESFTGSLAEAYETKVQFRKFTETLIEGCGPGCGTEGAKGQGGCESCTSCAVATACSTRKSTLRTI